MPHKQLAAGFMKENLFRNCVSVTETEDGLVPRRFTEKQLAAYAESHVFGIRSRCNAGVCIEFVSDTRFVELSYAVLEALRDWIHFGVHLNGMLTAVFRPDIVVATRYSFRFEIPEDKHGRMNRIAIYLPFSACVAIQELRVSADASIPVVMPHADTILCLGDSITQGQESVSPSSAYAVLLASFLEMNLLNQGLGCGTFQTGGLDGALPFRPKLVTVSYGTNDWRLHQNLDELESGCDAYLSEVIGAFPEAAIYVITPIWRYDRETVRQAGTLPDWSRAIADIGRSKPGVTVIDGMELVPPIADLFSDGVHPNDAGFLHYALQLAKRIRRG